MRGMGRAAREDRPGPGREGWRRTTRGEGRRPPAARLTVLLAAFLLCACAGAEEPGEVRLTLVGTTDVHGTILPYDYATGDSLPRGLARAVTLVDSIRETDPHVLLLDSGDLLQGTPLNSFQAARRPDAVHPVIAAMNAAGYDASAIGNHEFNYGIPYLRDALEEAEFPFLAANIHRAGTDSTAWRPYALLETGGVRVGVIGFTTPGVAIWDRAAVEGRLEFRDIAASARRWVPRMKEEGAEVVVALAHSGIGPGSSYAEETGVPEENAVARLAREVPEIDVIFAGHSHGPIRGERIDGTLVLNAGSHARNLAVAHLVVRRHGPGEEAAVLEARGELVPTAGAPSAARIVEAVLDAHRRTLAWLDEPIGWTPDRWSAADARYRDTPIADLITTVERRVSGAELASTAIFDPSAELGPGPITRRDILELYVYPNTLKAVRIDGADLKAYLERSALYFHSWPPGTADGSTPAGAGAGGRDGDRRGDAQTSLINDSVPGFNFDVVSGVEYAIDLRNPPGERIVGLRRDGRPVTPADSFTLALNNYRQTGGGGFQMVAEAPLVFSTETEVAELLMDFVQERDTLTAEEIFEENWRILPPEAVEALVADTVARSRR